MADFVMTIESDSEDTPITQKVHEDAQLNPDFTFDASGDPYIDLLEEHQTGADVLAKGTKLVRESLFLYMSQNLILIRFKGAHFG